jgi:hypothetical protein
MNPFLDFEGEKFIKVGFPVSGAPGEHEWMWVRVTSFSARFGILNNDPIGARYVQDGSPVYFEERDGKFFFIESPDE